MIFLPEEVWLLIFSDSNLSMKNIASLRRVCKLFNRLTTDKRYLKEKMNVRVPIETKYIQDCLKYNLCVVITFAINTLDADYYFRRDVPFNHLERTYGNHVDSIFCIACESTLTDPLKIFMKRIPYYGFHRLLTENIVIRAVVSPYVIDEPVLLESNVEMYKKDVLHKLEEAIKSHIDIEPPATPGLSRLANLYKEFPN